MRRAVFILISKLHMTYSRAGLLNTCRSCLSALLSFTDVFLARFVYCVLGCATFLSALRVV